MDNSNTLNEEFKAQYKDIVENEHASLPPVKDPVIQHVIYQTIKNTTRELSEDTTTTGDMAQYTPVVISLIRRIMPTLTGPQMVGMQAMNLPTGRIFVQHVLAGNKEVWGNGEVGTATAAGPEPDPNHSGPYSTADGEKLGWKDFGDPNGIKPGTPYPEMSFSISSVDVSVKSRALKGKITTEVISDLRTVHGLDAEQEIANIMQAEITAEIDREIVRRIYTEAKVGGANCNTPGTYDFSVDADGRWSMEKIMGLMIQIEREATWIAQETRRGRGNFILTSPELAAYLSMANLITNEYKAVGFTGPVNPVGISYYGMLANRYKVFVDPYLTYESKDGKIRHRLVVGYKGINQYDAGIFYCPYIPIQWYKATGEEDFGVRMGVKSRYGIISNPYALTASDTNSMQNVQAVAKTNSFYRQLDVVVD